MKKVQAVDNNSAINSRAIYEIFQNKSMEPTKKEGNQKPKVIVVFLSFFFQKRSFLQTNISIPPLSDVKERTSHPASIPQQFRKLGLPLLKTFKTSKKSLHFKKKENSN